MSRAFKNSMADLADDLSSGALDAAGVEQLSGADLEQVKLAALNGSNPAVSAAGAKTLGTSLTSARLATVTADAANTVTVDTCESLFVGQVVDIVSNAGVSRADNRTLSAINFATRVCTYSGGDASASVVAGDYVILSTGPVPVEQLNGADLEYHSAGQ